MVFYLDTLYFHKERVHNTDAAEVVVPLLLKILPVKSVLDVGCGTGTWLKVFSERYGINEFLGIDGAYVDKSKIVINEDNYKAYDLREPFDLGRKYDLVLCLEVAEHIPEKSAGNLISSLCKHSDTVLFSAAIPGQVGQNHVNEQWPLYWDKEFNHYGYKRVDAIRPLIWNDDRVDVWYKQNIFIYAKNNLNIIHDSLLITPAIHPDLWYMYAGNIGIKRSVKTLYNSIKIKLKSFF